MFFIGHIYGIGDCGLARMTSRCPDCGETIGGDNYHLVGTSQDADELNDLATLFSDISDP